MNDPGEGIARLRLRAMGALRRRQMVAMRAAGQRTYPGEPDLTDKTFADLGLAENILRALSDAGYTTPTPIQAEAIPHILTGGDVTGIAQTGTGKTAAFVLPMIQRLSTGRARARMPRCLILCPTRELAAQVAENFEKYGKYLKLTMALLIGGVSFKDQEMLLQRGVDVLIATPGRLLDQFERGKLLLIGVETLIIDEADRMLDMGFIPDIEKICQRLPASRQTLLFSATFPADIQRLARTFQRDPKKIEVARPAQTAETIMQHVVKLPSNDPKARRTALRRVIEACNVKNGIVFCNRKVEVDIVAASLTKHGHNAAPIHGDLPQSVRTETLQRFRDGSLKLLVASDVAARGLDIPDVSHVFNFGPPPRDEDYVHRIGRTGRAGRRGESYTLVSPVDEKAWGFVLKMIKKDVAPFMPVGLLDELASLPPEGRRDRDARRSGPERGERSGRGKRGEREARTPRREVQRDRPAEELVARPGVPAGQLEEVGPAVSPPEVVPKTDRGSPSGRPRARNDERTAERRDRRTRPQRDARRKDDAPSLAPAPERVKGFGSDVPSFLRKR